MISLGITLVFSAAAVAAGSLADIDHVVLFMQENRAFDHVRPLSWFSCTHKVFLKHSF
jgi:phospholipase C